MLGQKKPRVVLLGFDACDIDIVRAFARAGKLPTFDRLLNGWTSAEIKNPFGFFVGATWTTFSTAKSAAKIGFHCWETISLDYKRRMTSPAEIVAPSFWGVLGAAGRKVAVLDVPHSRASEEQAVLEITEYGCHDRHFGLRSSRAGLRDEIQSRFGYHPVFTVDPFAERHFAADDYVHRAGPLRTAEEERLLQRDLFVGLENKRKLSRWIHQQDDWDLFMAIFGESHAVGHQSWYLHDPSHPRHDPALARELGDPVEKVYAALDRALAEFLSAMGDECTVLVLLSHGMRAHYDGTYVLEPVLTRLNAFDRLGLRGSPIGRLIKRKWLSLDDQARQRLTKPLMSSLQWRCQLKSPYAYFESDIRPVARSRQRYYMSPNNSVYGGVRINLKGREPAGTVEQGREFDSVCAQLKDDLLALINVHTGDPVVKSVERTDCFYDREPIDELPDLIIDWNHEAPVETVWSAKTGLVHAPYWHWRTGDHRPEGFLFASGAGIPTGAHLGVIDNLNLGPTICAMLGVELSDVDGQPLSALTHC